MIGTTSPISLATVAYTEWIAPSALCLTDSFQINMTGLCILFVEGSFFRIFIASTAPSPFFFFHLSSMGEGGKREIKDKDLSFEILKNHLLKF